MRELARDVSHMSSATPGMAMMAPSAAPPHKEMRLLELSSDALCSILYHLPFSDIVRARQICQTLANCSRSALQHEEFLRRLPIAVLLAQPRAPVRAWLARLATPDGAGEAFEDYFDIFDSHFSRGSPLLYIALVRQLPEAVLLALVDLTSARVRNEDASAPTLGWPLLHAAAAHGASARVVTALLGVFPEAAHKRGRGSRLALHLACSNGAPPETIAVLLAANPKAAESKAGDAREGLPLHMACVNGASASTVDALVRANPRAATLQFGRIGLPLHGAVECCVQAWRQESGGDEGVTSAPSSASQTTSWRGWSAAALDDVRGVNEVIEVLVRAHPEGAKTARRTDNKLPIHIAAEADEVATALAIEADDVSACISASRSSAHAGCEGCASADPSAASLARAPSSDMVGPTKALAGAIRTLLCAHPITPDWPAEALLRARTLGEGTLLRNAHTACAFDYAERQRHMMIALELGAPVHVLRALASAVAAAADTPALVHNGQMPTAGGSSAQPRTAEVPPAQAHGPFKVRVVWRPGVRVRAAPSVEAAVVGVRRAGEVLLCDGPPDPSTGWVALAGGAGHVCAALAATTSFSRRRLLEVVASTPKAPVHARADADSGQRGRAESSAELDDALPQAWSSSKSVLEVQVVRAGERMGVGGSYVVPPTVVADELIAHFRERLRLEKKAPTGDAAWGAG